MFSIKLPNQVYEGTYSAILSVIFISEQYTKQDKPLSERILIGEQESSFEINPTQAQALIMALIDYLDMKGFKLPDQWEWMKNMKIEDPTILGALKTIAQLYNQGFKFKIV